MAEHQYTQQTKKTDNTSQKQIIPPKQISLSNPMAIIQRARINPKSLTYADVMQLQRTIGNRAVARLLSEIGFIPSAAKQAQPVQMQTILEEEEEPLQGEMTEAVRRQEKPLQGKMVETIQRQEITEEEEPLQTKKENNTGMPDKLKADVEIISGIDMSDVRVHYNSGKPTEVGALAYTQGTDVHVAPGQEKHLPHEAWHVVQQVQGRVRPTMQLKNGVLVNDDTELEHEADVMGKRVIQLMSNQGSTPTTPPTTAILTAIDSDLETAKAALRDAEDASVNADSSAPALRAAMKAHNAAKYAFTHADFTAARVPLQKRFRCKKS